MTVLLVVLTIVAAVALEAAVMRWRRRRAAPVVQTVPPLMGDSVIPQGIFVAPNHSWLRLTVEGVMRLGIDDLITQALGRVDIVEMAGKGADVKRGDPLLRLQVGKREAVVTSPIDGMVVAVNEQLREKPWLISRDPYGAGWILGLWARDIKEAIRPMHVGNGATTFLRQEMGRFIDFLTSPPRSAMAPVLADGGLPRQGVLANLDDSDWASFHAQFLTN
jgi:glycine cleavage system H lipoate-binding protein